MQSGIIDVTCSFSSSVGFTWGLNSLMSHMLIIAKADIYEGSMKDIFGFQMNAISETVNIYMLRWLPIINENELQLFDAQKSSLLEKY